MSATPHASSGIPGHTEAHVAPLWQYFVVFGALIVLTVLTVAVSYADLGPLSIYVALAVAIVKASLVALYFMHLAHDEPVNGLVLVASLVFLGLFFFFTAIDLFTRGAYQEEEAQFQYWNDKATMEQIQAEKAAKAAGAPAPAAPSPTGH